MGGAAHATGGYGFGFATLLYVTTALWIIGLRLHQIFRLSSFSPALSLVQSWFIYKKILHWIFVVQGPKFVSDEEIERIKAKIEEDNRAIAALESKKYGEKPTWNININNCNYMLVPGPIYNHQLLLQN